MRTILSLLAAASAHAATISLWTSQDCSGTPLTSLLLSTGRCEGVMYNQYGVAPLTCTAGTGVSFVMYGTNNCSGAPVPGILVSATTSCSTFPAALATCGIWPVDSAPRSMQVTEGTCAPDVFDFTTCGRSDCTIGPGYGCSASTLPTTTSCVSSSSYRFKTARGVLNGSWVENVTMYANSDTTCTGTQYGTLTNLPVDGRTCRTGIGSGGAYASAPASRPVSPVMPAATPKPAPPASIRCWTGTKNATSTVVTKAPGLLTSADAYCVSYSSGTGASLMTVYTAQSSANLTYALIMADSDTGKQYGLYQDLKVCSTQYCNDPNSNGVSAVGVAGVSWALAVLAAVLTTSSSA